MLKNHFDKAGLNIFSSDMLSGANNCFITSLFSIWLFPRENNNVFFAYLRSWVRLDGLHYNQAKKVWSVRDRDYVPRIDQGAVGEALTSWFDLIKYLGSF